MSDHLASLWNRECTGASCAYCNAVDDGPKAGWKRTAAIRNTTPRALVRAGWVVTLYSARVGPA